AAGKHRSLSIALVLVYVFGLELWCPSVCEDPFETPDQVPIFKHASKKIDSMIGQLLKAAEFRLSCTVAYTGVDKWIKSWPSQPAMLKMKSELPELYDTLTELDVDKPCWTVMCSLSQENSALAREFVFFCERKRRESGYTSLRGLWNNPSAVVMKHAQSRFNKITGHQQGTGKGTFVGSSSQRTRTPRHDRDRGSGHYPAASWQNSQIRPWGRPNGLSCHHDDLDFDFVFDQDRAAGEGEAAGDEAAATPKAAGKASVIMKAKARRRRWGQLLLLLSRSGQLLLLLPRQGQLQSLFRRCLRLRLRLTRVAVADLHFNPPPPPPAFLSLKTRVCWMLSSDDFGVAKQHGGNPTAISGVEADPRTPTSQGEARDSLQAGRGKY
ncbi:unnamed protein product, partial [Symbiodinium necroappetens]